MARVYDSCQYIQCSNGKHNKTHLFRFPADEADQLIWVENTGNFFIGILYLISGHVM